MTPLAAYLFATLLLLPAAFAQNGPPKPAPDVADYKYGPHPRNVLDLWRAESDKPTPLVVYIHGGGFRGGDKSTVSLALIDGCRKMGVSVAAVNYRFSPEVTFPAHYLDCARAIQTLRHKATDWNLDPKRVAATGSSAGAGTSLWLGFHDDLADPKNSDPVLRESTRLTCMVVVGAQSTYDPRVIKQIVGGRAHEHSALQGFYGLKDDELDSPRAHKLYEEAAPINYLTADDPPVYAIYREPKGPLPDDARPGQGIHHPNFGKHLHDAMDKLHIECIVRHKDDGVDMEKESLALIQKYFAKAATAK